MHHDDFLPQRGVMFARAAMAKAAAFSPDERIQYAERRWGARSEIVRLIKGDVSGHESTDADFETAGTREAAAEFGQVVDGLDLIGRAGLASVPAGVPFLAAVTDPSAYWIGGGGAVPVSRAALDRATLNPKQVGSLIVLTNQLLNNSAPRTELTVLQMMKRAARRASDAAFIDPDNSGDDMTPPSITNAATPITSSGDLADDVLAAIAAYGGALATACWAMHPATAAQAGVRYASGVGAELGALGGRLAGLPALTSEGVPMDSSGGLLVLFDTASCALVDEGYAVSRSKHGMVAMSDAPTGDTTAPTSESTKMVSLFQEDATGLLLLRRVHWRLANPAAVVVIEGCDYSAP